MYDSSHSRAAYELPSRIELLYQQLLDLEAAPALDPALAEILRLLADAVQCELVYVELSGRDGDDDYWLGHATFPLPPCSRGCRRASSRGMRASSRSALPSSARARRSAFESPAIRVGDDRSPCYSGSG